ncbi:MAG: MIP family channel protein [Polyangiales bacterium]
MKPKLFAEMVGTFALVFAGCGAIMVNELTNGSIGSLGIALTFGFVIMVMVQATGHISGAHFNPSVTIAFASAGYFRWKDVPSYIVAQSIAALFAVLLLQVLFDDVAAFGATFPAGTVTQSFALEVIITFFLMFVITAVATDERAPNSVAGLAIGGTVALCAIFAGPISGASMNPARSLWPALLASRLDDQWIYLAAPTLGAVLGAFTYRAVSKPETTTDDACCR